jgi:hypothetical protein
MPTTTTATRPRRKAIYYIRNWSAYDRALVQRSSLTIWLSEEALAAWGYQGPRQRGAQFDYSDQAIEAVLTLKEVFHLSNREAEGLVCSVFALMQVTWRCLITAPCRGEAERSTFSCPNGRAGHCMR